MGFINTISSKSINDVIDHFKTKRKTRKALAHRELLISSYLQKNKVAKLQLGCGHCPIEGWLNTDLAFSDKVAFMDAGQPYPLKNDSFEYVFCEHLFEHLTFSQEMNLLKESHRILKQGGKLRIAMPNLDFLFKLNKSNGVVERNYINHAINGLWNLKSVKATFSEDEYSEVFVINNFFKDWGHQIIHNFSSIELMLKKAGFSIVELKANGVSNDPVLNNLEQHGKIITQDFNLLESFVVEAVK